MQKIILKNGKEMVIKEIYQPAGDKLSITIVGITNYQDFRSQLNNKTLSEIMLYTGKKLVGVYEKYTKVLPVSQITDNEDGTMDITITLQQEGEIESRMSSLENAVGTLIKSGLGAI